VFNFRISGIIAGIAFVISFIIGLVSHVSLPLLIIRSLILTVVFFILVNLIYFVIKSFLPELLDKDGLEEDMGLLAGSRINITEGDTQDTQADESDNSAELSRGGAQAGTKQAFMGAQADDSDDGLGNISELMGKFSANDGYTEETIAGMDQNAQDGYTKARDFEEITEPGFGKNSGTGSFNAAPERSEAKSVQPAYSSSSTDILPDLDSMVGAFVPASEIADSDNSDYSASARPGKQSSGHKAKGWSGDFNAKDMASGLRTILRKEKEG